MPRKERGTHMYVHSDLAELIRDITRRHQLDNLVGGSKFLARDYRRLKFKGRRPNPLFEF